MGWGLGYPKMRVFGLTESHSLCLLSKPPAMYQLIAGNGVFSVLRFDFMAERPLMGDVLRHKRFGPEPTHGPGTAALCFWAPI